MLPCFTCGFLATAGRYCCTVCEMGNGQHGMDCQRIQGPAREEKTVKKAMFLAR